LLAQFENETSIKKTSTKKASTKKKSSNSTAAVAGKKTSSSAKEKPNTSDTTKSGLDRDRLRIIPGESTEDRQRRLRRESRANKKLSAASVPLPSHVQVNATSASAVVVPLPPYFLGSLEPRRLQNLGNTCFINATLQCLFNCFSLLDYISMPLGVIRDFFWLAKAVRGYLPASTDSPANQYGLLRFLPFFPLGGQQDAMDYLQRLFVSDADSTLTRQFEFTLITSVMCGPNCREYNHQANLPAPTHHTLDTLYTYLSVTVEPDLYSVTLVKLLELFFRPEHLPPTYNCSIDSTLSPDSMKLTAWKTYPSILLLQLGRFVFNQQTRRNKKNDYTRITVPLVLSPDYSNITIQYHLIGVVFHHGKSSSEGHYTACTFDKYNINGVQQERWNLHNDSSSTPISNMVQHLNRFCRDVYMLLYRRVT
jgi:ubiquitin C-terminal hydrolase